MNHSLKIAACTAVASGLAIAIAVAAPSGADAPGTTTSTTTSSTAPVATEPEYVVALAPTTTVDHAAAEALEEELMVLNAPYLWGQNDGLVTSLQTLLGVTTDGYYGPVTRAAHLAELTRRGLPTSNVPAEPPTVVGTGCPEWEPLAVAVGWPADQIPKLSRIIRRESNCHPDSWNRDDPGTGSRGLTQINSYWCTPNKFNPTGFLQAQGVLDTCDDLFDPTTSLAASLIIWQRSGWNPWGG